MARRLSFRTTSNTKRGQKHRATGGQSFKGDTSFNFGANAVVRVVKKGGKKGGGS